MARIVVFLFGLASTLAVSDATGAQEWRLFGGTVMQPGAMAVVGEVGRMFARRHMADSVLARPAVRDSLNCGGFRSCVDLPRSDQTQLRDAFISATRGSRIEPSGARNTFVSLGPPYKHPSTDSVEVILYVFTNTNRWDMRAEFYYLRPRLEGGWVVVRTKDVIFN